MDPRTILNCLLNNNEEEDTFHPKTKYVLRDFSVDRSQFLMGLGEHQLGKAYVWAQNLCGLNYQSVEQVSHEKIQDTVPIVVNRMRTRLRSRFQLYCQIVAMENKTFNALLPANSLNHKLKIACILAQWSPITFSEVQEKTSVINRFVDEGLITENHLLYHAVIIRGQAKMDCFVNVSPNFSADCPIWAISLNFHGNLNAVNSSDIRVSVSFDHMLNGPEVNTGFWVN